MQIDVAGRSYPLFIEPRTVSLKCDAAVRKEKSIRPHFVGHPEKHLVLLHGWNAHSSSLWSLQRALRESAGARDRHFWNVDFPTHRWSFVRGAQEIARSLRATGCDFSDTILLGYSMGGVVARQMVADGFPCRALVSVASPHEGLARWVPTHSPGTASLHRRSRALKKLNEDSTDETARSRYHFFSISYTDVLGAHAHDGLVMQRSALGAELGEIATRQNIAFDYGKRLTFHGPHMRGMEAHDMTAVIAKCAQLMQKKYT